jgi:hypothetical protein
MARVVVTKAVTLPATAATPAVKIPAGAVLEVTTAQATAISTAGGTTRSTTTSNAHDQLGEAFGVSNSD